ncbi:MAG: hypothetical protein ABI557_06315, partial [Aureliella sp.]
MGPTEANLVSAMIHRYAASSIKGYRSNLSAVMFAVEHDFIPHTEDAQVHLWMRELAQAMADSGVQETDSFLLRYALTVPGMLRGLQPPIMALEENRGGFHSKRQREAAGQIGRLREALSLADELGLGLPNDTQQAIAFLTNSFVGQSGGTDENW